METHQRSRGGRKRRSSFRVLVAIAALQHVTVPRADPLDRSCWCRDVEGPAAANGHPPYMRACLLASGHNSTHEITRLEPLYALSDFRAGAWKPIAVHAAHLPTAMSFRCNEQGHHAIDRQALRGALAHAGRIQPVALG